MKTALLSVFAPALRPARFPPGTGGWGGPTRHSPAQVGLWAFMAVVCMLFLLFGIAYMMRIGYGDWRAPPSVPWQLWLSTTLLTGTSVAWRMADWRAAVRRRWCLLGLFCALAFVASQLGAWRVLAAQGFAPAASPGAGFFYMLTGLHALHVAGGIVAAVLVMRRRGIAPAGRGSGGGARSGVSLCGQYWHLLLALWLALFALLFQVTPALVQDFCATLGIGGR